MTHEWRMTFHAQLNELYPTGWEELVVVETYSGQLIVLVDTETGEPVEHDELELFSHTSEEG